MTLRKTIIPFAVIVLLYAFCPAARALDVAEKDIAGTEYADGLTDKQLAVQRWFAELTYLNHDGDGWTGWYTGSNQLGLDSIRYSLAFLGYAAGTLGARTPAYTELTGFILDDVFQRMIQKRVWEFINKYWHDDPHFPDPVAYENIMYSGHVAQLLALYETFTGDMKYSDTGWDFVWDENTIMHYNGTKLMQVLYDQVDQDARGGIPCEPNTIFVICNDHPHNAFRLYDAIHGTAYAALDQKWQDWMEEHAVLPRHKGKDYLKISFMRDREMWTTSFGTPGSDGWALAWMFPWTQNKKFVCDGWEAMRDNTVWKKSKTGGSYLKASVVSSVFGVDDATGTCFYPLVEAQCHTEGKSWNADVFAYFENKYGTLADTDGDGFKESYYYDTDAVTRVWVTANLAAGMVTKGDSLRDMYREPLFKAHQGEPKLAHVPYPAALVKKAVYTAQDKTLSFTIVAGTADPGEVELVCENIGPGTGVTRNGVPFNDYTLENGTLKIKTKIQGETEFQVRTPEK